VYENKTNFYVDCINDFILHQENLYKKNIIIILSSARAVRDGRVAVEHSIVDTRLDWFAIAILYRCYDTAALITSCITTRAYQNNNK